jgi:hypothetical protein
VGEAGEGDEAAEVAGDELRAVVGDDPRLGLGVRLEGALEDELDVGFGHAVEEVPVHDEAAVAVEHGAQVVVRPAIVMTAMSMCQCMWGPKGWTKPVPFLLGLGRMAIQAPGEPQDPVDGRRG